MDATEAANRVNKELNRALIDAFVQRALANHEQLAGMVGGLSINPTDGIDGMPVRDGFTASVWDRESGIGITAIVWGQQRFKAFVEMVALAPSQDEVDIDARLRIGIAGHVLVQAMREFADVVKSEARKLE